MIIKKWRKQKKDKKLKKKVLKTIEAKNSWVGGMKRGRERRESEMRKEKIMDTVVKKIKVKTVTKRRNTN